MKKQIKPKHGEDYLSTVESIQIKLEDGSPASFSLAAECFIPDDPKSCVKEARDAHSRYAFWAYQTERALNAVRRIEASTAKVEGEADLIHRKRYDDIENEDYTETMIRSSVDIDASVAVSRAKLRKARHHYGILRCVRDAMEHRCNTLRRLVAQESEAKKG